MKSASALRLLALAAGALIPVQAAANAALNRSPRLGVGTAIALVVTGQVMAALAIDHFGLLRSLTFPLTPVRALGAALMVIGVFLALRR
jgi:uncharacterized membrane protein YdcZ (DUF606 family)